MKALRIHRFFIVSLIGFLISFSGEAQCTNYTITVTAGAFPLEIDWEFSNSLGSLIAAGGAPATTTVCLTNGTYYFDMYDWYGDGWNGATYTIACPNGTVVSTGTLSFGYFGFQTISINASVCGVVSGCPSGTSAYTLQVTAGLYPSENEWQLLINGSVVTGGGAPATVDLCLTPGCYTFEMYDWYGDGWDGAQYTLLNSSGTVVYSGTLAFGYYDSDQWAIGVPSCSGGAVTASDCITGVNVCNNLTFTIDPNGFGLIDEISAPGTFSNPFYDYGDGLLSPWGTDHYGCLLAGETNSTWMIVNIWGGGSLEFTFGGLGTQSGFYDWIMYPYNSSTCQDVYNNAIPPVRCNWNAVDFGGTGLAAATPPGGFSGNFEPPLNVIAGQQYLIVFSNWSSVSTVVPLQFGGTAIVSCQNVLTPVELAEFAGEERNGEVMLSWATLSELQTDRFTVETSRDGQGGWTQVGSVAAATESYSELHYSLVHSRPDRGLNYYRLLETDQDNQTRSLAECAVMVGDIDEAWVIPNPNDSRFRLPVWMTNERVRIYDVTGREIDFSVQNDCALCAPEIEMTDALPGMYYIVRERTGDARHFLISD